MDSNSARALPVYQCHKVVWALKIKNIVFCDDGSASITPAEEGFALFKVSHEFVHKHAPKVGGYYVVYKDGYASFSPAAAFEEGYTLIS